MMELFVHSVHVVGTKRCRGVHCSLDSYSPYSRNLFPFRTETGALTVLYAATCPEAETLNGNYLVPWARVGEPNKNTQDANVEKRFWEW
ncbi:hypothetical protein JOM56_010740 [Amanita muscaria]